VDCTFVNAKVTVKALIDPNPTIAVLVRHLPKKWIYILLECIDQNISQ
jgi:hypothetical protein